MKVLNKILGYAMAAVVALMVIGCCWQVFTRFVLNNPSKYTEKLLRYALIWMTMLGAPYAYGQNKHLAINVVTRTFQPKNLLKTKIVTEFVVMALSISVFIIGGIIVTLNSAGQISPAMQMPMEIYYACVPISGVLMVLYCINRIVEFTKELKEGK